MLAKNDVVKVTTPFTGEVIVFVSRVSGEYFWFELDGQEYLAWIDEAQKLN